MTTSANDLVMNAEFIYNSELEKIERCEQATIGNFPSQNNDNENDVERVAILSWN